GFAFSGRDASVNERGDRAFLPPPRSGPNERGDRALYFPTMAHFGENWDEREFPLAYLITIRTYGTWLHGDERGSVDQHGRYNRYGADRRSPDKGLKNRMLENLSGRRFTLDLRRRQVTENAIREVCRYREYDLHALNVKPTHSHAVVSANLRPEL